MRCRGPADRRRRDAASDQDVAGSAGRGDRRAGTEASDDPQQGRGQRHAARRADLARCSSNLYMRRFVLGWKALGHEQRLDAHIVNYADDFVICCRGTADEALAAMRDMMSEAEADGERGQDARLPDAGQETFDFLGYTFGRCYSPRTGRAYIGTRPSKKRIVRICAGDQRDDRPTVGTCRTRRRWWPSSTGCWWAGPTTSAWVRSAGPTARWTSTRAAGCVSGCAPSTRCSGPGTTTVPDRVPASGAGAGRARARGPASFPWAKA